jgi:hypothetical protein
MKKFLVVVMLMAFVIPATLAFAASEIGDKQAAPKIKCCFDDGQCLETQKDNCALKKGIVVQDCKDCPGVWGKGEKKDK